MMTRRLQRCLFSAGFVLLIGHNAYAVPKVEAVRHAVKNNNTRVVIDVSKQAGYKIRRFENPHRIAVNIPDVHLAPGVRAVNIEQGVVKRVRFNQLSWGSQVVLDLKEHGRYMDFYLAPMDGMPYRIVLDVSSSNARSPLPPTRTATLRSTQPAPTRRPFVVAIDAGHGGQDPGATAGNLVEKKAALDIARRLERELEKHDNIKAFLTRDRDVFLSLPERTRIAKARGADIFVSIHLNSAPKRSARGSEVFFLHPAGAQATASKLLRNRRRAAAELGLEGRGSDDLLHMLVDVNQQSMMERSSVLAEEILTTLNRKGLPPTRMIKQRSFAVLKSIAMPSVMVETGFVTNKYDTRILSSESGRAAIATAIADGVEVFFRKHPPPVDETGRILVHRVQKGDTLWKISRKYNTSVTSIQKSNRLGSSQVIRVGQELVIREKNETY